MRGPAWLAYHARRSLSLLTFCQIRRCSRHLRRLVRVRHLMTCCISILAIFYSTTKTLPFQNELLGISIPSDIRGQLDSRGPLSGGVHSSRGAFMYVL